VLVFFLAVALAFNESVLSAFAGAMVILSKRTAVSEK
jgi:hypothetical protein